MLNSCDFDRWWSGKIFHNQHLLMRDQAGDLLFTKKMIDYLSILIRDCRWLKVVIHGWTPRLHLFFCNADQLYTCKHSNMNTLRTSSLDVVLVLNCFSNLDFLLEAGVSAGEDATEVFAIRVSTSLGHPQVPVGLSMGNPQVKWPTDLILWVAQVFADLGSTSVETGTCHRYPPYLSLTALFKIMWNCVEQFLLHHSQPQFIRKSARRWYDQIVVIAPNLVDATFYL